MRDILFRAKGIDEDDKDRWYEGFYIALNDTTLHNFRPNDRLGIAE